MELWEKLIDYLVFALVGVMAWFFRNLQGKAERSELDKLREEVSRLREYMFKTLATKDDVSKLDDKLDKLIQWELNHNGKN